MQLFEPVDYVQLVMYPFILLFGVIGNILVVLVVRGKKRNRKINDYFILNLAITDLCVLTISISADFFLKFETFPFGILLCKGIWPLMTMCLFASIFTLTCMAIERERTIVKPLSPRLALSNVPWVLASTWLAGLVCVSPLIIVAYDKERGCGENWPTPFMRQAYTVAVVLLQYALPLLVITIAYARIGIFLKRQIKTTEFETSGRTALTLRRRKENAKINKNLLTIVTLFAIFMLPLQILWLWLDFGSGADFKHFNDVLVFSEFLLYIHSSTNPVVYGTILQEFRLGFCRYIRKCCPFIARCCMKDNQVPPGPLSANDNASRGKIICDVAPKDC